MSTNTNNTLFSSYVESFKKHYEENDIINALDKLSYAIRVYEKVGFVDVDTKELINLYFNKGQIYLDMYKEKDSFVNFSESLKGFEKCATISTEKDKIFFKIAQVHHTKYNYEQKEKSFDDASDNYNKALLLNDANTEYINAYGELFYLRFIFTKSYNAFTIALEIFQKGIEIDKNNFDALFFLAQLYTKKYEIFNDFRDCQKALDYAEQACLVNSDGTHECYSLKKKLLITKEIGTNYADSLKYIQMYEDTMDEALFDKALEKLKNVEKTKSEYISFYNGYGKLYRVKYTATKKEDSFNKSYEYLKRSLNVDVEDIEAYSELTLLAQEHYLNTKDPVSFDIAKECYGFLLSRVENPATLYISYADLLIKKYEFDNDFESLNNANKIYEQQQKNNQNNIEILEKIYKTKILLNDIDGAIEAIQKIQEKGPIKDVGVLEELANLYYSKYVNHGDDKSFSLLINNYQRILAENPKNINILLKLANSYMKKYENTGYVADLDFAYEKFNLIIGIDELNINAYTGIYNIYVSQDKFEQGINFFENVLQKDIEVEIKYLLGKLYMQAYKSDSKSEKYKKAIENLVFVYENDDSVIEQEYRQYPLNELNKSSSDKKVAIVFASFGIVVIILLILDYMTLKRNNLDANLLPLIVGSVLSINLLAKNLLKGWSNFLIPSISLIYVLIVIFTYSFKSYEFNVYNIVLIFINLVFLSFFGYNYFKNKLL